MPAPIHPRASIRVAAAFRHDHWAFTQGLAWHAGSGTLYESTGRYGDSSLRRLRLDAKPQYKNNVEAIHRLENKIFAEGIAIAGNRIYQTTWHEQLMLSYDLDLKPIERRPFPHDGWGLTTRDGLLVMSDGSAVLRAFDPDSLAERWQLPVHAGGMAVEKINDIEFVPASTASSTPAHYVANIYRSNRLARIHAETGAVLDWIDLHGLLPWYCKLRHRTVMNGLAWRADAGQLFVTGKYWPRLFALELPPPARA